MKQARLRDRGTMWLLLLLLLGWSACLPTHVPATDLPVIGGLHAGGNEARSECPKGSYLLACRADAGGGWIQSPRSVLPGSRPDRRLALYLPQT